MIAVGVANLVFLKKWVSGTKTWRNALRIKRGYRVQRVNCEVKTNGRHSGNEWMAE